MKNGVGIFRKCYSINTFFLNVEMYSCINDMGLKLQLVFHKIDAEVPVDGGAHIKETTSLSHT